jgi:hypothetical protein
LNRAGQFLYVGLVLLAVLGVGLWQIEMPRLRFSDEDEHLFRRAGWRPRRHRTVTRGGQWHQ